MHARIPTISGRVAVLAGLLAAGATRAGAVHVPPPPDSPVTDLAGVLSPATRTSLARRLTAYEAASGHQVVVYIDRTAHAPIEQFAADAFAAWKLGRAGHDDALTVFALTEDRAIRVEVGYGLEPQITDLEAAAVIRTTMLPRIREGRWDDAIIGGVEALVDAIEDHPDALPADVPAPSPSALDDRMLVGLAVAAMLLLLVFMGPRRAFGLLLLLGRVGRFGGGFGGGGIPRFRGGGGRSGGGGASGRW